MKRSSVNLSWLTSAFNFICLMHGIIFVHKNNKVKLIRSLMMFGFEDMDFKKSLFV